MPRRRPSSSARRAQSAEPYPDWLARHAAPFSTILTLLPRSVIPGLRAQRGEPGLTTVRSNARTPPPSRAQRPEDHIHVVAPAPRASRRGAEVGAEDGGQCPVVRQVEIADRCGGDVDLHRVEAVAKDALRDAALEDFADRRHQ